MTVIVPRALRCPCQALQTQGLLGAAVLSWRARGRCPRSPRRWCKRPGLRAMARLPAAGFAARAHSTGPLELAGGLRGPSRPSCRDMAQPTSAARVTQLLRAWGSTLTFQELAVALFGPCLFSSSSTRRSSVLQQLLFPRPDRPSAATVCEHVSRLPLVGPYATASESSRFCPQASPGTSLRFLSAPTATTEEYHSPAAPTRRSRCSRQQCRSSLSGGVNRRQLPSFVPGFLSQAMLAPSPS